MPLFPKYQGPSLLDQVCRVDNLTLAWQRVRRNIHVARRGKSAGPDAVTLRDFEADWANQMAQLADALATGSYRPLPPRRVSIPKASGGERAIAILAVRDRIAQRAVQQVLEPLFDPLFLDCSFGCRPRVGVPHALAQVSRYAEQGRVWVVDADIASYFDSLDQRILLGLVRQRVDELAILRLIQQWLETGMAHTSDHAPLSDTSPFQRGSQMIQQFVQQPPPPSPRALPAWHGDDPYLAASWEQSMPGAMLPGAMPPASGFVAHGAGWDQRIWAALALAKPVMDGARYAWPYVQKIGTQRLAVAGTVAAGAVAAGELARRYWTDRRGTPQGGALSPLLANIYLHPFDLALSSQGWRLVRFVDDFVILCTSQAEAEQALAYAQRQLKILRLDVNEQKTRLVNYADGLDFLGQALLPHQRKPRLVDGVQTFEEAEQALRRTAQQVRGTLGRRKT